MAHNPPRHEDLVDLRKSLDNLNVTMGKMGKTLVLLSGFVRDYTKGEVNNAGSTMGQGVDQAVSQTGPSSDSPNSPDGS